MKKVLVGVMVVVVLGLAAVAWAAQGETKQVGEGQKAARPARPTMPMQEQMRGPGPNMQGMGGIQQAFEARMKQQQEEHAKAVGELEEIKKIAESEKATKTAEALQKMIDKKNGEYKKNVEEIAKKQKESAERIQKRQAENEARNAATPPVKPAQPATEEKKAGK